MLWPNAVARGSRKFANCALWAVVTCSRGDGVAMACRSWWVVVGMEGVLGKTGRRVYGVFGVWGEDCGKNKISKLSL